MNVNFLCISNCEIVTKPHNAKVNNLTKVIHHSSVPLLPLKAKKTKKSSECKTVQFLSVQTAFHPSYLHQCYSQQSAFETLKSLSFQKASQAACELMLYIVMNGRLIYPQTHTV